MKKVQPSKAQNRKKRRRETKQSLAKRALDVWIKKLSESR